MAENIENVGITGAATGFELVVGPAGGVIENADVPVRWCVTSEAVKALEDAGVKNPYIVLSTSNNHGGNEWRTVVPLGDMMAYARFYQAGEMNVYAIIIDAGETPEERKRTERRWMQRDYGEFERTMQYCGVMKRSVHDENTFAATTAHVEIPEGVFGKEPSERTKWFVNLWHGRNKVDDQCEYRRRAILAFTLKWIPVTIWSMIYIVGSFLALAATYGTGLQKWITNWKMALHPFDGSWSYMWDSDEGKYGDFRDSRFVGWITWDKQRNITQPVWSTFVFSPLFVVVIALLAFGGVDGEFWWYDLHQTLAIIFMIIGGVVASFDLGCALVYFIEKRTGDLCFNQHGKRWSAGTMVAIFAAIITMLVSMIPWWLTIVLVTLLAGFGVGLAMSGRVSDIVTNTRQALDRAFIWFVDLLVGKDVNDYTEIRELLCPMDNGNLSTDINSIPKEHRTWRLRFHAFKQKVCKPMQR